MGAGTSWRVRIAALAIGLLVGLFSTFASADSGGYPGHQAIPGDFNGDSWIDVLIQSLPGFQGNAEFLANKHGGFGAATATWPDQHINLDWNANAHKILVGDFNGDGRDDLFLQAHAGFTSAVLLADPDGQFRRTAETPLNTVGGLDLTSATIRRLNLQTEYGRQTWRTIFQIINTEECLISCMLWEPTLERWRPNRRPNFW